MNVQRTFSLLPISGAYFAAASVSLALTRFDGGFAFLWIASSVMIADLVMRARAEWWPRVAAMALASVLATGLFGMGWAAAVPLAVANMVEGLVGAVLLQQLHRERALIGSLPWLGKFVLSVGAAAPLAIAIIFGAIAPLFGLDPLATLIHVFTGHALGNIAFTPMAMLVRRDGVAGVIREMTARGRSEAGVLLGLLLVITTLAFAQTTLPLLFLPLLPVILITFRLGYPGAVVAAVLVALIAGGLTLAGRGPVLLVDAPFGTQIQFLQFYLAALVLTALPVAADLENRSLLLRAMRLSDERYRLLAEHSTDMLLHVELNGTIRYVSPSVRQLCGYNPEALTGRDAATMIAPEHRERVRQGYLATIAAEGGTETFEYLALTRAGERRWFESHARVIVDLQGEPDGLLFVVRDIAARKKAERATSKAAMIDVLTGLPNRRAFESAAQSRALAESIGEGDCIALFDIDCFKRVNDVHGHDVGDAVLQTFAEVLRRVVRGEDVVGRLGGEEFAVLFPDTCVQQALMICERLREEMALAKTDAGGAFIQVTVSGGVATLGPDGLAKALKRADRALYTAKRGGRDQMALAA